MSFPQRSLISLLNLPLSAQNGAATEDPFDDFLNIPDHYTFEDGLGGPDVGQEERQVG
jgi:hypothetical protein